MTDASHFEAKKDGLQQKQDGCWKFTVTVHPNDMPPWLLQTAMGTRLMLAAVEIGDNEEPVPHDEQSTSAILKPKRRFGEMSRAQQAGILCNDPTFQDWIRTHGDAIDVSAEECALDWCARCVRWICGVNSRVNLDIYADAGQLWDNLVTSYRADTGQTAEER